MLHIRKLLFFSCRYDAIIIDGRYIFRILTEVYNISSLYTCSNLLTIARPRAHRKTCATVLDTKLRSFLAMATLVNGDTFMPIYVVLTVFYTLSHEVCILHLIPGKTLSKIG